MLYTALATVLFVTGCPAPPKVVVEEPTKEKSHIYKALSGQNQKEAFDLVKDVLGSYGIIFDPTLQTMESSGDVLPRYDAAVNILFLPQPGTEDTFLRAAADAVGSTRAHIESFEPIEEKRKLLIRFARNLFLFHELAEYLRHQIKDYNFADPFKEDEIAQGATKALTDHFMSVAADATPLLEDILDFYGKALQSAPSDFPGFSEDDRKVRSWFNENHAKLLTTSQNSYILYLLLRQFKHLKLDKTPMLTELLNEHVLKPAKSIRENIDMTGSPAVTRTIHRDPKPVLTKIGHFYEFRGLAGIAAGPAGRVFFSDYYDVRQVSSHGSIEVVEGSQGIFAPTSLSIDREHNVYFVDRDMVRVVNLAGKTVGNINLNNALKDSAVHNPYGITPVAVTPDGQVLVANNATRTLYMFSRDGAVKGTISVNGAIGGIAFHQGCAYVTNTAHHTVDKVDFSSGTTTVAGVKDFRGHGDGRGFEVFFNFPTGICIDGSGAIFVADTCNHAIRRIDPDGTVSTVVGLQRGNADGPREMARLHCPVGVDVDKNGTLFVAELASRRVVAIGPADQKIETAPVESTGYTETDSTDKAIADFTRIIKRVAIGFKLFDTLLKRGRRYRELGDHAKSVADLEAAINIAPDKLSAYIEAGLTREAAGQNAEAIEIYGRAIDRKSGLVPSEKFRDRDYLKALIQRGLAQASEGNHEAALQDLTTVLDLRKTAVTIFKEPDLASQEVAQMWFARGRIYLDSGNNEKAIEDLGRAITLDSRMIQAYYFRGVAYSAAKKYHLAIKDLKTAASLSPSFAEPHFELGKIYQSHVVDSTKAIQHLKTYLELDGASKLDAQARIDEIEKKLSEKTSTEGNYWEKIVEDEEGKRWIERHYSDGRVQRFPLEKEK